MQNPSAPTIFLASSSPYRRGLLDRFLDSYETVTPDVDESNDQGLSPGDLATHLATICSKVVVETSTEQIERTAGQWIESVRGRFVSTLQFVPPDELEAGIARFVQQHPNDDDVYRSAVHFTRVRCVV